MLMLTLCFTTLCAYHVLHIPDGANTPYCHLRVRICTYCSMLLQYVFGVVAIKLHKDVGAWYLFMSSWTYARAAYILYGKDYIPLGSKVGMFGLLTLVPAYLYVVCIGGSFSMLL